MAGCLLYFQTKDDVNIQYSPSFTNNPDPRRHGMDMSSKSCIDFLKTLHSPITYGGPMSVPSYPQKVMSR